jgi:hypothetical protein
MSGDEAFEPDSVQIVSDLGQLRAFAHPLQARMLRILQKQEATGPELATLVGEPASLIGEHVEALVHAGLVKISGQRDESGETLYRAGARYYGFRPDPSDLQLIAGPLSLALLETVGRELTTSMDSWPSQRMIGQIRRARLSSSRLLEFEERFEELVNEFWGSPDQAVQEKDGDPVMSLASVVYRYPDQD